MSEEKAKEFLEYLHSLESELRNDLFCLELLKTVEAIRFKFIESYQSSKGEKNESSRVHSSEY